MKYSQLFFSFTLGLLCSSISYAADHSEDNSNAQSLYQSFLQNAQSNAVNHFSGMYGQLPSSNPLVGSANSSGNANAIAPTSG